MNYKNFHMQFPELCPLSNNLLISSYIHIELVGIGNDSDNTLSAIIKKLKIEVITLVIKLYFTSLSKINLKIK